VEWINSPHVARWWDGEADMHSVTEKYEPRVQNDSPTTVFVIQLGAQPVGFIQCYRHKDYPDWDRAVGIGAAAGIDYLIGDPSCIGKGIGSRAIRAMTKIVFDMYSDVDVVVSAPQRDNRASWRALEKAGFTRVSERKLDSDCPSDSDISYIYEIRRTPSAP
jgi:aminoglycoside 6'-N-acetyltransferase